MSTVMFSQTFGGAVFLTLAQVIFSNSLHTDLPKYVPSVDPQVVIGAGATAIRDVVSAADLPGVLLAYSNGIDRVFYLAAAASVTSFFVAWGMGWKDIRSKKKVEGGEV